MTRSHSHYVLSLCVFYVVCNCDHVEYHGIKADRSNFKANVVEDVRGTRMFSLSDRRSPHRMIWTNSWNTRDEGYCIRYYEHPVCGLILSNNNNYHPVCLRSCNIKQHTCSHCFSFMSPIIQKD